jgi:polysaccharide export outer membrane protein
MVRYAALIALAVALAIVAGAPACAQTAADAPRTLQPAASQLRYSSQIPPGSDDVDGPPPAAAPTKPVDVAPEPAPAAVPTRYVTQQQQAPAPTRYATQAEPQPSESVTVTALRQTDETAYRLGSGDKLRVTVFNETDLSGEFEVDGMGYVRLPLIGQIEAAGLSAYQLEERITEAFLDGKYLLSPRVNVEVTTYRPFYIIGEVAKPGEYAFVNAMTAPNAIALAGGYTDRAVEETVYIRHQGDAREAEVPADASTRIRPGDVVRVDRSTYWAIMTVLAPLLSPFSSIAYLLK